MPFGILVNRAVNRSYKYSPGNHKTKKQMLPRHSHYRIKQRLLFGINPFGKTTSLFRSNFITTLTEQRNHHNNCEQNAEPWHNKLCRLFQLANESICNLLIIGISSNIDRQIREQTEKPLDKQTKHSEIDEKSNGSSITRH